VTVGFAGGLSLENHLGRIVDRRQSVVLSNEVRQVGHVHRLTGDVGIFMDRVVRGLRPKTEAADDLSRLHRLEPSGDDACSIQVDDPVGEHLSVDPEVANTAFEKQWAHCVRHGADPDLQAGAVLNLCCDEPGDGPIGIGGRQVGQLRQRVASTIDDVVDLAHMQPVFDAVDVGQRRMDLDNDDRCAWSHGAVPQVCGAEVEKSTFNDRARLDHHDVYRVDEASE
jgi:hypothetical protein